ncbi:MAG: hypothetical protein M3313_14050 [Actinomycetota bacterium]|nr:hypothetical protein [Actinomycetota bacterium]
MTYRAWPAVMLTGAALTAACVVVGEHVVQTSDGCLDAAGLFTATAVAWPDDPVGIAGKQATAPDKPANGPPRTAEEISGITGTTGQHPGGDQITGCLDLDRIQIPAPTPVPDGRA